MQESLRILTITAASIAFIHTIFGPDHYLPFIVMARARGWSRARTVWITLACGLGSCEPLIPLLMYPAARQSTWGIVQVSAVFGIVTMATMLGVVLLADAGIRFINFGKLERYTHAFAGGPIFLSGFAVVFLGL